MTEQSVVASAIDTLPIDSSVGLMNQDTGAAGSADGERLVIHTYAHLLFFRLDANGCSAAIGLPCQIGPRQRQGEAVDFLDSNWLVLTSETALGQAGGLARAACLDSPPDGPIGHGTLH